MLGRIRVHFHLPAQFFMFSIFSQKINVLSVKNFIGMALSRKDMDESLKFMQEWTEKRHATQIC